MRCLHYRKEGGMEGMSSFSIVPVSKTFLFYIANFFLVFSPNICIYESWGNLLNQKVYHTGTFLPKSPTSKPSSSISIVERLPS